jgi:hypothetical protein
MMGAPRRTGALPYYRLANGKIAVNDVMFDPDLMEVLWPAHGTS